MAVPFQEDSVSGFLHIPAKPSNDGLVLTHGAGANCQTPLLVAVAEAFESAGFTVLRCDLPFRQKRSSGPPHPAQAAEDRQGLKAAIAVLRKKSSGRVLLGGHSYGGRQASILASEDSGVCDALLLLSYPLHPPNKPAQLRTSHFPQLQTPSLLVHGTKDPFATIEELKPALLLIPAAKNLSIVEGAGHDLKRGRFDINALILQHLPFIK
jgi:uncharacterized protein